MRWLFPAVLAFVVAAVGSPEADAQAFKPRGKTTAPKAKKAPAAKSAKATPRRVVTTKKRPSSRVATQSRPDDLTPDVEKNKPRSPEEADDYVLIEDDDE